MSKKNQLIKLQSLLKVLAVGGFSVNIALADGVNHIIAGTGNPAAGTAAGTVYSSFSIPVLNNNGQVAYRGFLNIGFGGVTSFNNSGIWRDNSLIAREGFQATGTPTGALFSDFSNPVLNNNGQVAYKGFLLAGTGDVTSSNNTALWLDNTLIAREGFQAAGTPIGALFSSFDKPVLNNNGQMAYRGTLQQGPGGVNSSNYQGIWRDNLLTVRSGFQAGGTPTGALFSSFGNPVLNNNGQVAYRGFLGTASGGVTFSNNTGIWRDNSLIAREGFQASGTPTGALFSSFSNPVLNNNAQVAYWGSLLTGTGSVTSSNNSGIWRGNSLIVREGFQAAGTATGSLISELGSPLLNNNGQVAYFAALRIGTGDVTSSNDLGIWRDNSLVAREGFQASGTATDALFSGFGRLSLNNNGQLAYLGNLQHGTGGLLPLMITVSGSMALITIL